MEWKELIKAEIDKGFSKADIETLVGLPKNNLASGLSGKRELSKINILKIERWLASEKPDPLDYSLAKVKMKHLKKSGLQLSGNSLNIMDLTKNSNMIEPKKPLGNKKSNFTINTSHKKTFAELKAKSEQNAIPRLEGESSIEYRLRMIEENKK